VKLASGASLFLLVTVNAYPQEDKVLQQALKKFQDDYARPNAGDDERIQAVLGVAQYKHEKIAKALAPLLTKASYDVRIVVARELGKFQGVEAAGRTLQSALGSGSNATRKMMGVRITVLRGLGALRFREAATDVDRLIDDKEVWIAKAAIDASGKIRVRTSVDPLIKSLRRIEGPEGDREFAVDLLEGALPPLTSGDIIRREIKDQVKSTSEREFLKEPILTALKSITRHDATLAKDWESWWRKNKATFKVAD
jgi:HEAT repeat protein